MKAEDLKADITAERERQAAILQKGIPPSVRLGPLSEQLLSRSRWKDKDAYPAWQHYADELEKLLSFAQAEGQFDRYAADLAASRKQRDSALDELRVALHLCENGFQIITWKPVGLAPKEGEYLIRGPSGLEIFVEVKSPIWESELRPEEIQAGRTQKPQYLFYEGRAIAPWQNIQYAVEKAYDKFRPDIVNLLVVPGDGLFVSLRYGMKEWAQQGLFEPHYRRCFSSPAFEKLGGLGIFSRNVDADGICYQLTLFLNEYVLLPLPDDLRQPFSGS